MRIYEGSPRQQWEEVLRSIGAFADREALKELLLLELESGFVLQGLGLQAGGAVRKQRRGEPLSAEEEEVIGRWSRLSLWRKFIAIGAFGMFALIVIPVMYAYVSELYPTELRASGFGWASSSSRAITGFAPLLFGSVLWPVLGLPLTFTLLGLLVVAAVIFMWVEAPETAGRELDRITTDVPDEPASTTTDPERTRA